MNEHCGEDTLDGWKKFALDGIIPYFSSLDLWSFYCKEDVFSVVMSSNCQLPFLIPSFHFWS